MSFELDAALRETVRLGASDLHVKVPASPRVRVGGELIELEGAEPLTPADTQRVAEQVIRSELKRRQFEEAGSADLSYYIDEGRFRVAAFRQRGSASFVFRAIPNPPEPSTLGLPDVVATWADAPRGLVVVTGPTGTGKSTTVAAILELVNRRRSCHIVTIEDPIEFLHRDQRAIVTQREIGLDARDNHEALRAALRQDPDVMLIGEVRDEETAHTALRAAETGHLVLCTMHTLDATETVQRFIDLFVQGRTSLARQMLAATLVGIVSQRLIARVGGGRVLNSEVLVNTSRVRDLIADSVESNALRDAIAEGDYYGMHTFDQDLLAKVREGLIDEGEATAMAANPHDFRLLLAGSHSASRRESLHVQFTREP